ncbi:MAG: 16S rRNA (adenine(1518)-N(6)/adenine(1519)-N(6))-dimethyltransferase RsmA [Betaproteobacteria bacterium]
MQHRPRKRFSQNFLVDRHYIERIVAAIAPASGDTVVEIGPGRGALTRPLLLRLERLTAIEIDRDLAAELSAEFPPERLALVIGDALTTDIGAIGRALRIVGNLPYHVSSPLLFHCAQFAASIADMHFMLQSEVVDRMAAAPDTPEFGRLSVTLQSLFAVEKLFRVPAGAFNPVPAVESAVVRLKPLGAARPFVRDRATFEAVVAAGFGQRRKTLRNALQSLIAADALKALGIDPGARAETLAVGQFIAIANAVAGLRSGREPANAS